jgi:hypothetical protein
VAAAEWDDDKHPWYHRGSVCDSCAFTVRCHNNMTTRHISNEHIDLSFRMLNFGRELSKFKFVVY